MINEEINNLKLKKGGPLLLETLDKYLREEIAREIEDLIDPPPIDEIDYIVVDVIKRCANIARGVK